jgi:predicted phage baseplate assembly protein
VTLIWEYRPDANPGFWRRLQVFEDQSAAFTREGAIMVEGPSQPALTSEGRVVDPRYWLRIRVASGAYPAGMAPLVDFIRPNVVDAENLATVLNEPLGQSRGTFPQTFQLRFSPVVKDSLQLGVTEPGEDASPWTRKDDLLGSGPDDQDFVLNAATGEISFGDGINGRLPVAGADITALQYRYGGGEGGNLGAGLVNALLTPIVGIDKVTNERPAVGGRDEETLAHLIQFAPAKLRGNERAVAAADFTALARSVGGIGNAIALPLFHPDHRGVEVAGVITVVVVPDNADRPPRPSPDQIEAVCTFLNKRRLLTTELYVKGPEYLPVEVEAVVEANPYAAFDVVRLQIIQALNAALDPMVPDPTVGKSTDGVTPRRTPGPRDFGEDFFPTKLYSVIQNIKDVRAVSISAVKINGQRVEDFSKRFRLDRDQMLYSAPDHTITVIPFKDL